MTEREEIGAPSTCVIPIEQIMPAAVEQNRVRGLAPMITRIPDQLLTRDRGFYRSYFKGLPVLDPSRR